MAYKRENGAGSVYKRSDARYRPWVAVAPTVYVLDLKTGKKVAKRLVIGRYDSRAMARKALEQYQQSPTTKYNDTVAQVYEAWKDVAFRTITKQTQDNYTACWAKVHPIHKAPMRELRTGDMQAVLDSYCKPFPALDKAFAPIQMEDGQIKMTNPLSHSSLTKIKALLTQLCDYAMQNDIVNKNYATFLSLPRQEKTVKDCFTTAEVAVISDNVGKIPFADCILMMCYTGFRIAEFLELTPDSYDPDQETLTGGKKTSAGTNRTVPVHKNIRPLLQAWLAKGGDAIICNSQGKAYRPDTFRRSCYYTALDAMPVRRLPPHATRHTFATRLAAAGARTEDIQRLAGHEDYEMTANTYIHQDVTTLRAAIDLLE